MRNTGARARVDNAHPFRSSLTSSIKPPRAFLSFLQRRTPVLSYAAISPPLPPRLLVRIKIFAGGDSVFFSKRGSIRVSDRVIGQVSWMIFAEEDATVFFERIARFNRDLYTLYVSLSSVKSKTKENEIDTKIEANDSIRFVYNSIFEFLLSRTRLKYSLNILKSKNFIRNRKNRKIQRMYDILISPRLLPNPLFSSLTFVYSFGNKKNRHSQ